MVEVDTKHTNTDYLTLLAKLRKHAEWHDGGHGLLHKEAADAIAELIEDGGLEVPPGSQIPPPPARSEPVEAKLSEEELEEELEQDIEELGSKPKSHGKARSHHR